VNLRNSSRQRYLVTLANGLVTMQSLGLLPEVTKGRKETAEKVPSVFEKWGLRGTFELKYVLISPQERGKLGEENTFSALSKS
jgi:hypothetical protein